MVQFLIIKIFTKNQKFKESYYRDKDKEKLSVSTKCEESNSENDCQDNI